MMTAAATIPKYVQSSLLFKGGFETAYEHKVKQIEIYAEKAA